MKRFSIILGLILGLNIANAQIDGNFLLGLTHVTNAELGSIINPIEGALLYNSSDKKISLYTGSNWDVIGSSSVTWNTFGNTGISAATDFLGTTDAQDLILKSNNEERLLLSSTNQTVRINQAFQFNNHPLIVRANGDDIMAFQNAAGTTLWHWNINSNGLNFVETGVLDYRLFLKNGGGIGINTDDPTEELDVNGNARIRSLGNAANTDDVLTTDATGVLHRSKINYGGRWTNTDTSTNLNVDNVVAPIFGSENYKDDGNNSYEVSGNTLIVKEAGRYDIRSNISLLGINSTGNTEIRTNANGRIAVNGTVVGAIASSAYIRFGGNHTQASIHMNEILELNDNDVISIIMFREANSGTVRFSGAGESSFMINKLR